MDIRYPEWRKSQSSKGDTPESSSIEKSAVNLRLHLSVTSIKATWPSSEKASRSSRGGGSSPIFRAVEPSREFFYSMGLDLPPRAAWVAADCQSSQLRPNKNEIRKLLSVIYSEQ